MPKHRKYVIFLGLAVVLAVASPRAFAGSHTWKFAEAFSNADGTIQFIEFREPFGGSGENFINSHTMSTNTRVFNIGGSPLVGSTAFKTFLVATPGFAALPGAPTPDRILPANLVPFFSRVNDTLACSGWPSMTFTAGQLPTDGIHSLTASADGTCSPCTVTINSPKNFAGTTAQVDASTPPPGVPESGATPVTVAKLVPDGSSLSISFDTATCADASGHAIIYGSFSQLPTVLGGTFGVGGAECAIGTTSPYTWNAVPDAGDGSGLLWWLVVKQDGADREGSWGNTTGPAERIGPGTAGSSGQCGVTTKSVSNACGH